MNNLHFIKGFNRIMLCNYSKDDLYVYKKAQMMLNVSIILLFAGVASTIAHYSITP